MRALCVLYLVYTDTFPQTEPHYCCCVIYGGYKCSVQALSAQNGICKYTNIMWTTVFCQKPLSYANSCTCVNAFADDSLASFWTKIFVLGGRHNRSKYKLYMQLTSILPTRQKKKQTCFCNLVVHCIDMTNACMLYEIGLGMVFLQQMSTDEYKCGKDMSSS